jgi:hypothetical protein
VRDSNPRAEKTCFTDRRGYHYRQPTHEFGSPGLTASRIASVRGARARSVRSKLERPHAIRAGRSSLLRLDAAAMARCGRQETGNSSFVVAIRPPSTHLAGHAEAGARKCGAGPANPTLPPARARRSVIDASAAVREGRPGWLRSCQPPSAARRVVGVSPRHPGCLSETAVRSSVVKVRVFT